MERKWNKMPAKQTIYGLFIGAWFYQLFAFAQSRGIYADNDDYLRNGMWPEFFDKTILLLLLKRMHYIKCTLGAQMRMWSYTI